MRRHTLRALAVVGAMAALSLPIFNATHQAAACSQGETAPGAFCSVTITGGGGADFYTSPLTATLGSTTFFEQATKAELAVNQTATLTGTATFSVFDLRGNNQGFSAYLYCSNPCLGGSKQFPGGLAASDFYVDGPVSENGALYIGDDIGAASYAYNATTTGLSLDPARNPGGALVGGECSTPVIGAGLYSFSVPVAASVAFPETEIFSYPISHSASFNLTIVENTAPGGCTGAAGFYPGA